MQSYHSGISSKFGTNSTILSYNELCFVGRGRKRDRHQNSDKL
ncbi:MAG: hypothetical protein OXC46_11940 [Thaumarchaeota archaeon]|nr:hypothetical protein [Nitrososphaerota archaeon]